MEVSTFTKNFEENSKWTIIEAASTYYFTSSIPSLTHPAIIIFSISSALVSSIVYTSIQTLTGRKWIASLLNPVVTLALFAIGIKAMMVMGLSIPILLIVKIVLAKLLVGLMGSILSKMRYLVPGAALLALGFRAIV